MLKRNNNWCPYHPEQRIHEGISRASLQINQLPPAILEQDQFQYIAPIIAEMMIPDLPFWRPGSDDIRH